MNGTDTSCLCFSYDDRVLASRGGNCCLNIYSLILWYRGFYGSLNLIEIRIPKKSLSVSTSYTDRKFLQNPNLNEIMVPYIHMLFQSIVAAIFLI